MQDTDNDYKWGTADFYLAAAVMALGAEYDSADKSDPRRMIFYFVIPEDKALLEQYFGTYKFDFQSVEREWVNGALQVNAQRYANSVKTLKSIIHSSR